MPTSAETRQAFLEFFRSKGHTVVPSAPLVPANDPTLMFTNAGMVQFKDVFTGRERRAYSRAASSQKCIRISGKHNDLENVGVTARHHTFFEMLGNFSFGDYFKEDAVAFAWELLTKAYGLSTERMVVTVFGGDEHVPADDEARAIWRRVTGFGDERILGLGRKDNFWQMGDTGPCGPCTEIHYWNGEGAADAGKLSEEPSPDGRGWMEIWNLVFMQFEAVEREGGRIELLPLPKPSVDTGMGLERIASVLQGKTSNYETDLLRALVDKASAISGKPYGGSQADDDVSMRVIADHARTTAFLIAEGVLPDRAGRAYVLRRVMRRAIRHGHRLGVERPFLHEVTREVVRTMGAAYPELALREKLIVEVSEQEEIRFRETIERGLELIEKNKVWSVGDGGAKTMPGAVAFKLYDTYGFPVDLTQVIGEERGFAVDVAGFEAEMEEQRKRSEGSKVGELAVEDVWRVALEKAGKDGVRFTGYEREEGEGRVVAIVKDGRVVPVGAEGEELAVVTDTTPFYGEAGGQVGDKGRIGKPGSEDLLFQVDDTQKPLTGLVVHVGKLVRGALREGDRVRLEVDHALRTATRRNHSATHLLHWALRKVLGEQATQKGSLVAPDRLRFDFAHSRGMTPDEIARVEDLVNAKILLDAPVETQVLPRAEAQARGAVAIFEEKYGDIVRVLTMTKDSVELCGGTHARALGEIGLFKILGEGGLAAGVRRIEAATGMNALAYVRDLEASLRGAARALKSGQEEVVQKVERLVERDRQLDKELAELRRKVAMGGGSGGKLEEMLGQARAIPGGKALAVRVEASDAATLREMAEKLRDKLGESVVLVGAPIGPKAQLALAVSKGLTDRYKAGEIIRVVAEVVGGSGGGRPDMAQAGGTQVDKLDQALDRLYGALAP